MNVVFNEIEESVSKPESPVVNEIWAVHYQGSLLTRKRIVEILKSSGQSYCIGYKIPRKIYYREGIAKAAIMLSHLPEEVKAECSVVRYIPEI